MGEIRFVGTGETRGYPYPMCKKRVAYVLENLKTINFPFVTNGKLMVLGFPMLKYFQL